MSQKQNENYKVPLELEVCTYGNIEKISETLSKGRVRIFYKGLNRNRTFISDDFANQLISSLPYAPIKGIFNYADVDFEDHGEDNTDGRIYGIVAAEPNYKWEKHLDKDNVEREYVCADVILFTGLYPEANLILGKPQSMEIFKDTFEGEWKIWEDGKPYFHFKKGSLVGLQVLGKNVEPCFEGAMFFNLCKGLDDYLQYIKNINKEGEKMENLIYRMSDNQKADAIFNLLNPNFSEGKIDYWVFEVYDDYALCKNANDYSFVRVAYSKNSENDTVELFDKTEVFITDVTKTELTALEAMKAMGGNFEKAHEIFLETQKQNEALVAEKDSFELEKATLNAEKTDLTKRIEELEQKNTELENSLNTLKEENQTTIDNYEKQISELNAEKTVLENEKNDIISEKAELESFKMTVETEQKTAIIDEFSEHLEDSQIESFKAEMNNYSVADFKKEVCTKAYESNSALFSKNNSDSTMIFKGGEPQGLVADSGVIRILKKYKNGGNK